MPNRILRESICTSEDVDALSPEAEVFFYRLIVQADDFGRADGRLEILRARCFPLRTDTIQRSEIGSWLGELVSNGMVELYSVEGRHYLQLTNWSKYQRTRADASKFPDPPPLDDDLPTDDSTPRTDDSEPPTSAAVVGIRSSVVESRDSRSEITSPSAPSSNGHKPSPFAIDDGQGYLIGRILGAQPGWQSGKGALTYPGIVKLIKAHGNAAITEALQELWLRVQDGDLAVVRTPHAYLEAMAASLQHSESTTGGMG